MSLPAFQLPPSHDAALAPKLHLYTAATPNGHKVSLLLEELRAAYSDAPELAYDYSVLDISTNIQKSAAFLAINPNGRIPALVDDNHAGHNVFESASILLWLTEQYDKENKFWFSDPLLKSKALSWIFFAHGGVGPMQGQANHFFRFAPEKIPYGIKRYQDETARLYSVLEDGLKAGKGEYLVGDKYSVVDMNVWPWVRVHEFAGVDVSPFPLVAAWLQRIDGRPGTANALQVPLRPAPK
ncbi:Glutathione S-transferase 2 [Cryptotrichosporon argae]